MRHFFHSLFLLLTYFLGAQSLFANHYVGMDITYQCLNLCNYRINVTNYYDCSSAGTMPIPNPPDNPTFTCGLGGASVSPVITSTWTLASFAEITPVCPTTSTSCTQSSGYLINGVYSVTYYQQYDLCNLTCNQVCLSLGNCCRNYSITSGAGGNGIQIVPLCIDLSSNVCNNSPIFQNPPRLYICSGHSLIFNQGATDPDGDSLSYSLGTCYSSGTTPVNYNPGYSPTAPLGPTWQFSINAKTGDIQVTPTPGTIQSGVLCVYVKEWRKINGIYTQVSGIERDVLFSVLNCPNNNNEPILNNIANPSNIISNLTGATQIGTTLEIDACATYPFSFDCIGYDSDATGIGTNNQIDTMKISNVGTNLIFTAQNTAIQQSPTLIYGHSPLSGHFNMAFANAGTYQFTITLKDNACPIYGVNQYTITAHVHNCCAIPTPTINYIQPICAGEDLNLYAGGGNTYSWSGPNNFSSTLQNPILSNATVNMTGTYTVTVTDANACTASASASATIKPKPNAIASHLGGSCQGNTVSFDAFGGGNYLWAGPNGFSATAQNPTLNNIQPNMSGSYTVTVTGTNACTATASTAIFIHPSPIPNANGTYNILWGSSVQLNASWAANWTYSWYPTSGLNNISISSPIASPLSSTVYNVSVIDENGCKDIDTVRINVGGQNIENANWAKFISVYPNPTDGNLWVDATALPKDDYSISLYAANGQLLKKEEVSVIDGRLQLSFQLESMSSGVYMLRIASKNGKGEFAVKVQKK